MATKRRTKKEKDIIKKYSQDFLVETKGLTENQRISHFLNWAAQKYPKKFFLAGEIAHVLRGGPHVFAETRQEAIEVKKKMSKIRHLLVAVYNRQLHSVKGIGYRATVNSNDAVVVSIPKNVGSINASHRGLDMTLSVINPSDLTPENRKKFLAARRVNNVLGEGEFQSKMLTAAKIEE